MPADLVQQDSQVACGGQQPYGVEVRYRVLDSWRELAGAKVGGGPELPQLASCLIQLVQRFPRGLAAQLLTEICTTSCQPRRLSARCRARSVPDGAVRGHVSSAWTTSPVGCSYRRWGPEWAGDA